ncbi:MAG: DbpA RNA binding domain-containing protein, partial [Candidatus Poseidoniales archaeon]|nr:DbpA RNA binding domain-containing protein [Candidatus Poseidoniales archaeon]
TGRMGRKGEAWSFVSGEDAPNMTKIISTWNMVVNEVDAPDLPDGVDRDPVRKQMDWGESADVFGMVPLRLSIDATSKLEIHNFMTSEARLPDLAIGHILADGTQAIVEVHREKAQHTLDALKGKAFNGAQVNVEIAN